MQKQKTVYTMTYICKKYNVSRSVIEKYLSSGLIKVTSRNNRNYRMFDEETIIVVGFLRFLNFLGFEIPEIQVIADNPKRDIRTLVKEKFTSEHNKVEIMDEYASCLDEILDDVTIEKLFVIYKMKSGVNE